MMDNKSNSADPGRAHENAVTGKKNAKCDTLSQLVAKTAQEQAAATNPDHGYFYVSAIDGPRRFLIAGPYAGHEAALSRVEGVRNYACDTDPRAHFMAWGTASSAEPHITPLGANTGRGGA